MTSKTRQVAGYILLVTLLSVCFIQMPTMYAAGEVVNHSSPYGAQSSKLEGTWRVQVTIRDCQSGVELRTFPAMLTFAQGGTLTETTTGFPPTLRTPGHGFWQHTGDHTYTAVSEAFLFSPTGVWTSTQRLTQTIEIGDDPDQLTSTATNEIFDTNRNLLLSGCATAIANRLN